jgi:hypothetical protein
MRDKEKLIIIIKDYSALGRFRPEAVTGRKWVGLCGFGDDIGGK